MIIHIPCPSLGEHQKIKDGLLSQLGKKTRILSLDQETFSGINGVDNNLFRTVEELGTSTLIGFGERPYCIISNVSQDHFSNKENWKKFLNTCQSVKGVLVLLSMPATATKGSSDWENWRQNNTRPLRLVIEKDSKKPLGGWLINVIETLVILRDYRKKIEALAPRDQSVVLANYHGKTPSGYRMLLEHHLG